MKSSYLCNLILLYLFTMLLVLGVAEAYDSYDNRGVIERWLSGD